MSRALIQRMPPASPTACAHCPWRLTNQGKRTKDGFFSKRNLTRLWAGLRRGEMMSCHPTDERMNEFESAPRVKAGTEMHSCVGALTLIQRELYTVQECAKVAGEAGTNDGAARYRQQRGTMGLTERGIFGHIESMIFGEMPKVNLNDDAIGYAPLGHWEKVS